MQRAGRFPAWLLVKFHPWIFLQGNQVMHRLLLSLLLGFAAPLAAEEPPADAAQIRQMLTDFLAGASRDDIAAHQRFWADDLVYTSSSGRRFGKDEILRAVRNAELEPSQGPTPEYSAENVSIRIYGDAAVLAFRLLGITQAAEGAGAPRVENYFNTGTLVRRDGEWQVVAWQATKIPDEEEEAGK